MSYVTNPRGSDGQIMKCHECLSTDHLVASCLKKKGGKGKGKRFMTEQTQPPNMFAFQPGALQGIINGQSDTWFTGDSGVIIEEINEDEWETEDCTEGMNSASSGTQALALTNAEPEAQATGIRNSKHFFQAGKS